MTNVSYLYDDAGRITQETSTGQTSVSEYDESGNRRSVIYPMGGRQLVTSFDALNRVTTIVETKPGVTGSRTTGYFYDAAGNRLLCIKPHGGSETTSYDALSRKVSLTTNSGSTTVSSTIYGYDLASNVTVINEANSGVPDRVVVNDYDRAYRLTQETTVTGANDKTEVAAFTYDKANNRTARTRTTVVPGNLTTVYSDTFSYGSAANGGNSNQLMVFHDGKRFVDVTYTYDANGNRQQRLEGSSATHTYIWDSRNRLVEVTSPEGTSHYGYDYRTRRVLRDESSAGGTPDVITFSGGTSISERVTNTTVPTVEYIRGSDWGGGIGGILYTERGGSITHNAYNSRGDVIAKTDESGTITWQASYEAFGTRTEETGTNADRQRANTKEEDPTGLLNEGFRYRDLETGLFISRDPAGFVDGPNVYTYVRQNPWSGFDPDGLSWNPLTKQFWSEGTAANLRRADGYRQAMWNIPKEIGQTVAMPYVKGYKLVTDPGGAVKEVGNNYKAAWDAATNPGRTAGQVKDWLSVEENQGKVAAEVVKAVLGGKGLDKLSKASLLTSSSRVIAAEAGEQLAKEGVDLTLKYKLGWTDAQRVAADGKAATLTEADTVVTKSPARSGTIQSRSRREAGLGPKMDADHAVDLQLSGADEMSNMSGLDSSVNRSLGSQINRQIKDLPNGTRVNNVKMADP